MSSIKVCLPFYTVDAFTDVMFSGNPAAVCLLPHDDFPDTLLQKIAAEINLAETAFLMRSSYEDTFKKRRSIRAGSRSCDLIRIDKVFKLRWFTPVIEVKFCGHATLATAAILFNKIQNTSRKIIFRTAYGDLSVEKEGDWFLLDIPSPRTVEQSIEEHESIIKSLGKTPPIEHIVYCESLKYLLIRFTDKWTRKQFEDWKPNLLMMNNATDKLVVLIVTTRGSPKDGYENNEGRPYDFVSRCFDPWTGLSEDPVTGSAQTVLANYWSELSEKNEFFTRQCSKRGGEIIIRLKGNRVHLLGKAVLVLDGMLQL